MITVTKTREFEKWIGSLRDRRAVARIGIRVDRLTFGYFGDVKPVGGGVSEMRVDHGPGYRVYFAQKGTIAVLLLCGGDKSSQARDIRKAKDLWRDWSERWP
jgi:putative addiction module killer protein